MTELELVNDLSQQPDGDVSQSRPEPGEIVIGTLVGIDNNGKALVDYPANPSGNPLEAVSTIAVTASRIQRQVAILFAEGDFSKPIIIGLIHSPLHAILENLDLGGDDGTTEAPENARGAIDHVAYVDNDKVVIEGKKEIVLKCGDASITLTRAGKIMIRGNYLLNRSTGVNRIMGGSVQVN